MFCEVFTAFSAVYVGIDKLFGDFSIRCVYPREWEFKLKSTEQSIFVLPETVTKTQTERVVLLNSIANEVIEARRDIHPDFVFSYKERPLKKLRVSAWRRIWEKSGLPVSDGILKGVHNLRHTFGRRLRSAGVPMETRKALMGHANGDITTHYSAAEIEELIEAAEKVTNRNIAQGSTLTKLVNAGIKASVGKTSENKKRVSSY